MNQELEELINNSPSSYLNLSKTSATDQDIEDLFDNKINKYEDCLCLLVLSDTRITKFPEGIKKLNTLNNLVFKADNGTVRNPTQIIQ